MALRLRGATSGYIELKAPASAGDNTLTLPTNNGSANQLLKTDGSGNLSWVDDNSGVSLSGSTNNTIATVTGANSLTGEANLTFDGSSLGVTGDSLISNSGGNAKLKIKRSNTASNTDDYGSILFQSSANNNNVAIGAARQSAENDGYLFFSTASSGSLSERLRITSDGKIGIGETSPATLLHLKGTDTAYGGVGNSTTASGAKIRVQDTAGRILEIVSPGTAAEAGIGCITNHNLTLFTSNTERARFMSGNLSDPGLLIGTTSNVVNSANFGHAIYYDGAVGHFRDINGGNLTFRAGGNQGLLTIAGDGDALNTNNSYGQASDERLKQDIVDAASQWDDIKGLRVRKFRFKDNPSGVLQIGVIAQEIETVSAGLVKTNSEGIKSVKYSVLYMKTVKCLQEAIAKIETLETKVAALESA